MESSPHAPAPRALPAAPWVGGKRNLWRRIVPLIEATPHQVYAEPFVGMGGVFLRRRTRPPGEVINDLNADVATLFRVLQRHYVAFLEMLRFQLTTRVEFERLTATDPATLTDLERAARFLYLQRTAFGGKVVGRNFAMGMDPASRRGARFDVTRLSPMLEDLHTRLAGVLVERLPFEAFIRRYDAAGVLFYVDPPYFGAEHYYGADLFTEADFERLAAALGAIEGRFILSINDAAPIRQIFGRFALEEVETTYHLQASGAASARELIIIGP